MLPDLDVLVCCSNAMQCAQQTQGGSVAPLWSHGDTSRPVKELQFHGGNKTTLGYVQWKGALTFFQFNIVLK